MALTAAQQWWVRSDGSDLNGGGYDASVSGAGTNYCDQATAQLALTDLACANNTTLTSVTGGFTTAMIGNIMRIASGTNFTPGYYMVTARASTNSVTLDRNPTTGASATAGVGKLGGAFATVGNLSNGGTLAAPAVASALAAGHVVNIRGGGTDDPGTADYTHTGGYWSYVSGDTTSGTVQFLGYNGRPRFDCDALFAYNGTQWRWSGCKFVYQNATNEGFGVVNGNAGAVQVDNCYVDQNGNDAVGVTANIVRNCRFSNSGTSSAGTGTLAAILPGNYNALIYGNTINGWRGHGIYASGAILTAWNNVIVNCKFRGVYLRATAIEYRIHVVGNTIYGHTSDGLYIDAAQDALNATVLNNIFDSNGGYGVNCLTGSAALSDRLTGGRFDFNAYRNNTSGARNTLSAGAHDVTLTADPFTDAAGGDFTLNDTSGGGLACKATGYPGLFP